MRSLIFVILFSCAITISGCATYRGHYGFKSTDLSKIKYGIEKTQIEQFLKKPIRWTSIDNHTVAVYEFDRGYIPPSEEKGYSKAVTMPFLIFTDIISLGAFGAVVASCEEICQKGRLTVLYDSDQRLLEAQESIISDEEIGRCLKRKGYRHCIYVLGHPRPSTLSESLKNERLHQILNETESLNWELH